MKLVTYKSGSHPTETVLYTASGVRLNLDAPTAVEDDDVPELSGHKFEVTDAPDGVEVGQVVRGESDTLSVAQLKERLGALDLPVTGNKKELTARLRDAESAS